mgnify:CR=1 FL=1|tara:strand:+ start:2024 stop:2812 length:789 start_codon:yes stop_codon:yes gene_type:complete
MKYHINNESNIDISSVKHLFDSFIPFASKYLGISKCPKINFVSDQDNAKLPLGKTGFYDPGAKSITIFTDNRHIKDILRSLSHELVHHKQNLQGMFDQAGFTGPGYAQKNQHLRGMEREAYEKGNLCLRDWEDTHKKQLQESIYNIKGDNSKMSYKKWRNQEINDRLMESWGFNAPETKILKESTELGESEEVVEESEELSEGDDLEMVDHDSDPETPEVPEYAADGAGPNDLLGEINENIIRESIRKAITKALKERSNKED